MSRSQARARSLAGLALLATALALLATALAVLALPVENASASPDGTADRALPARQSQSFISAGAPGAGNARSAAARRRRRAPLIRQMIVFRSGRTVIKRVRAARTRVRVGRRKRCAVARGTPLAALARTRPRKLRLRDFGSCSRRRPRDGGGLFVSGIGPDRNRGINGWVYKVGRKLGTAGAADPSGPFGRGPLRTGSRVVWFYCFLDGATCQRTLAVRGRSLGGGAVRALAVSYDDEGARRPAAGATITLGGASATAGPDGLVLFEGVPARRFRLRAEQAGLVRSFSEWVVVR